MMRELQPATKLTIAVGGDERRSHHPLYQEILHVLHDEGIVGATLTRGVMSFGVRRSIHSTMNEITMDNLPIIIEATDEREKVERAASLVADMLGEHGLIEVQPVMAAYSVHKGDEGGKPNA